MSDLRHSQPGRIPIGSFADGLSLRPGDHLPFALQVRINPDKIFAQL